MTAIRGKLWRSLLKRYSHAATLIIFWYDLMIGHINIQPQDSRSSAQNIEQYFSESHFSKSLRNP